MRPEKREGKGGRGCRELWPMAWMYTPGNTPSKSDEVSRSCHTLRQAQIRLVYLGWVVILQCYHKDHHLSMISQSGGSGYTPSDCTCYYFLNWVSNWPTSATALTWSTSDQERPLLRNGALAVMADDCRHTTAWLLTSRVPRQWPTGPLWAVPHLCQSSIARTNLRALPVGTQSRYGLDQGLDWRSRGCHPGRHRSCRMQSLGPRSHWDRDTG